MLPANHCICNIRHNTRRHCVKRTAVNSSCLSINENPCCLSRDIIPEHSVVVPAIQECSEVGSKINFLPDQFYLTGPLIQDHLTDSLKRNSTPQQLCWADKLIWYTFLVLDNIPKVNKSPSNHFLTTSTYIQ